MKFELGKTYIVKVTENGIIPTEEFDESRWYDKDHDDLDFLTDEEKAVVVIQALKNVRAEIEALYDGDVCAKEHNCDKDVLDIIDHKIEEIKNENV